MNIAAAKEAEEGEEKKRRETLFDLGGYKIIVICVFQAGRLLLNESDFSTFQKKILLYKSYGVNPLDLTGFLTE